jgi:hypothetical protein
MPKKSGTQLLNEYKQNHHHTICYEEYVCRSHTPTNPQYGCRVWVDGCLKGVANNKSSAPEAKEDAALKTAESLLLI